MDDLVHLRLFQQTLIGTAAKWYIELPQHSFVDFGSLATVFLRHFQLPIHYEIGTDLLTSLRENTSTHISDHIHEWRRWRRLIKASIPNQLLADWFTKSLLPPIAWDVAMGGAITEDCWDIGKTQVLPITSHQQKTHSVGPFGSSLWTGYSLTWNSYGVPQNQVSTSISGILLYL